MKKLYTSLSLITLALAAVAIYGLTSKHSASANAAMSAPVPAAVQNGGVTLPSTNIYAITNDNTLFVLRPGSTSFSRINTISNVNGTIIGMDFRVADGRLYAVSDTGVLYTISLSNAAATQVSTLTSRFDGGVQSLLDFNPVANAIRLIGSNDQNYAVTNANGGNLNQTVVQTKLAYVAGDPNANTDPNITGGSYTNNFVGAKTTIFYALDYANDNVVGIARPLTATGSSNTGGGQLQTIGKLFDNNNNNGQPVNFGPTSDFDIYTDAQGVNTGIILNGNRLITFAISQINQNLPVGATQNLGGFGVTLGSSSNSTGFIDVAAQPLPVLTASR